MADESGGQLVSRMAGQYLTEVQSRVQEDHLAGLRRSTMVGTVAVIVIVAIVATVPRRWLTSP